MANIRVEPGDINLAALEAKLKNPQPLYKAWANKVEQVAVLAFRAKRAPYGGAPWAELTPEYRKRKVGYAASVKRQQKADPTVRNRRGNPKRGGSVLLVWTQQLYDTLYARVENDGVVAGAGYKVGTYDLGAIHQFGAPRAAIPARPYMPLTPEGEPMPQLIEDLRELAIDYFAD